MSGREALALGPDELRELDFITAPNELLANQLCRHVKKQTGHEPDRPMMICRETMMAVARTVFLPALVGYGMLLRYGGGIHGIYFDLTRYLKRCNYTWGSKDPYLGGRDPRLQVQPDALVTIDTSDPVISGGGVTFLQLLEYTRSEMGVSDKAQSTFTTPESLWRAGGRAGTTPGRCPAPRQTAPPPSWATSLTRSATSSAPTNTTHSPSSPEPETQVRTTWSRSGPART
jgi:hypothetical protein